MAGSGLIMRMLIFFTRVGVGVAMLKEYTLYMLELSVCLEGVSSGDAVAKL